MQALPARCLTRSASSTSMNGTLASLVHAARSMRGVHSPEHSSDE
jgi:hypothetical protein